MLALPGEEFQPTRGSSKRSSCAHPDAKIHPIPLGRVREILASVLLTTWPRHSRDLYPPLSVLVEGAWPRHEFLQLGTLDPERERLLEEVLATLELLPWRPRQRAKAPRAMVLDALQRHPPLHILNARDSVAAEFPKFEHLPRRSRARPLGQAERRPFVRRTPGEFQDHADRDR